MYIHQHVANRQPLGGKMSVRMTEVAMALESMAAEDAKVKACGMLLFDAELILHNLFELQRWHKTRKEVTIETGGNKYVCSVYLMWISISCSVSM
jgi:Ni2+-binding GTPase involved in maturation of urease and hydrogenase